MNRHSYLDVQHTFPPHTDPMLSHLNHEVEDAIVSQAHLGTDIDASESIPSSTILVIFAPMDCLVQVSSVIPFGVIITDPLLYIFNLIQLFARQIMRPEKSGLTPKISHHLLELKIHRRLCCVGHCWFEVLKKMVKRKALDRHFGFIIKIITYVNWVPVRLNYKDSPIQIFIIAVH